MNRKTKSLKSVLLLFILLTAFTEVGFAQRSRDEFTPPAQNNPTYIGTFQILATLGISGGSATCASSIDVYSGYEANLTMYLQRKTSSGYWGIVTSWSGTTAGSGSVSLTGLYDNLVSGTTYRVYAVGSVYQNGNFVERVSDYSQVRTY